MNAGYDNTVSFKVISEETFIDSDQLYYKITHLSDMIFINCIFKGFNINLPNATYINCLFKDLDYYCRDIRGEFDRCTFNDITINSCCIDGCIFDYCKFDNIKMHRTSFVYSDINGSTLTDLIITNCVFKSSSKIDSCILDLDNDNGSIAILNSRIDLEVTKCSDCSSYRKKSLYLYNCKSDEVAPLIHNNIGFFALKVYNSNLSDGILKVCPEEGSFICYKKLYYKCGGILATLEIPADARRVSTPGRKCRAEYAKVIKLENIWNNFGQTEMAYSGYDYNFIYRVGEEIHPDSFDDNPLHECSNGIHFFMSKAEAIQY